ncbi:PTS sugar transporter subunit IIA [Candidatus Cetobacterium colombiensis]|uniref:Ascorbate-specific PTS system EIIA component n=1 Tax=Candidatus Cetobacterium colombiensis TaxID=3073100 RepID=A0ABU4WDE1_9FUSO|nr:PTS sugar transporter subunit IIA [Candidatus Cetobacterium colombiensis]MDX8337175.1 PTS sugar transporter subunit IIA [Candidatus Cetobacterium colombiensis]
MKDILERNIHVLEKVDNWKDAIRKSGEILLKNQSIEERYIEAAIKNVEKLGNYIVITDNVAMPHARPEDGVNKTDLSLLLIKDGVDFLGENVNLVFMLASKDNSSHIEVIRKLSHLVDDEELVQKMSFAKNKEEILNYL